MCGGRFSCEACARAFVSINRSTIHVHSFIVHVNNKYWYGIAFVFITDIGEGIRACASIPGRYEVGMLATRKIFGKYWNAFGL